MTTDPAYLSPTNDLRGYLNIARRRKWSIILIAVLAAGERSSLPCGRPPCTTPRPRSS